jgi:chemotaxis protein MotB
LWLLTLAGGLLLAWAGWQRLEALERSVAERAAERSAATQHLATCRQAVVQLEERLGAVTSERDALTAQRDALDARTLQLATTLSQRDEELARLTATSKSLEEKLSREIARGDVTVTQANGRVQVDLLDKVLFDSAKAEVSSRGEELLTRLGAILATVEDRQIQISGHTDDAPITLPELKAQFASNWELSAARAVNVVRFLSEKARVKPSRLVAAGYGPYRPAASNLTPKGRAANRRIEVLLLPELQARRTPSTLPTPGP